ncbi:unnamed protein product, partial [Allacma fusca]
MLKFLFLTLILCSVAFSKTYMVKSGKN